MSDEAEYLIRCDVHGEAGDYILALSAIAATYGPAFAEVHKAYTEHRQAPHFTVKYWMRATEEQAEALWAALGDFAARSDPAPASLGTIGRFGDAVVFADHERSEAATTLVRGIMTLLRGFPWMQWHTFDNQTEGATPHTTIVRVFDSDAVREAGEAGKGMSELVEQLKSNFEPKPFMIDGISVQRRNVGEEQTYASTNCPRDSVWKTFPFKDINSEPAAKRCTATHPVQPI
mmetsp:Transcript_12858/g.36572  ORF Transcript_12858/g.36572 Transcript_12858/m.36572 type:complete len:232 (+) Transcript_12858:103-798(+)